jgi:hypothetical protein
MDFAMTDADVNGTFDFNLEPSPNHDHADVFSYPSSEKTQVVLSYLTGV